MQCGSVVAHKTALGFAAADVADDEPRVELISSAPVLATSLSIDMPVEYVILGEAKMM